MSEKSLIITKDTTIERLREIISEGGFPYSITNASLKDEYCNYGYDILSGPGSGDSIAGRKGSNIIHEDLQNAFNKLAAHMANLDDAFVSIKNKPKSIEDIELHDLTENFTVTSFTASGSDEGFSIILSGEKTVLHGEINLKTPKVNSSSQYAYWEELKDCIKVCQLEVILYMHGKANPAYEQSSLEFPKEDDGAFEKES